MEKERILFRARMRQLFGQSPVGRPRRRWVDNIEARNLGFEGTRTEWATDSIRLRGMVVTALGYKDRCGQ